MEYSLRAGDLIKSDKGYGIVVRKTAKYIYYHFSGFIHRIPKDKLFEFAASEACQIYLGTNTSRRRRKKRHKKGENDV